MNFLLTFHAERLYSDEVWLQVQRLLAFLHRYAIRASFFCVAPVHPYYRGQPSFSEATWEKRLHELVEQGHTIEQHTHFYGSEGKKSDTASENLRNRLNEDRQWLQAHGFTPRGFVGGGWIINREILELLQACGYEYDCSARSFDLPYLQGPSKAPLAYQPFLILSSGRYLMEIPTTAPVLNAVRAILPFSAQRIHVDVSQWGKYALIYMHDYDLLNPKLRLALGTVLYWHLVCRRRFMSIDGLYKELSELNLPVINLEDIRI